MAARIRARSPTVRSDQCHPSSIPSLKCAAREGRGTARQACSPPEAAFPRHARPDAARSAGKGSPSAPRVPTRSNPPSAGRAASPRRHLAAPAPRAAAAAWACPRRPGR
jgi:hypothetical protein